jgi:hypothetical protein
MNRRQERERFYKLLKSEIGIRYNRVVGNQLINIARRYHSIQERWCNEQMEEATTRYYEHVETRLEKRVTEILKSYLGPDKPIREIIFTGDPRGYTIKLKLASGRSNDMGGEEFGIPTE